MKDKKIKYIVIGISVILVLIIFNIIYIASGNLKDNALENVKLSQDNKINELNEKSKQLDEEYSKLQDEIASNKAKLEAEQIKEEDKKLQEIMLTPPFIMVTNFDIVYYKFIKTMDVGQDTRYIVDGIPDQQIFSPYLNENVKLFKLNGIDKPQLYYVAFNKVYIYEKIDGEITEELEKNIKEENNKFYENSTKEEK